MGLWFQHIKCGSEKNKESDLVKEWDRVVMVETDIEKQLVQITCLQIVSTILNVSLSCAKMGLGGNVTKGFSHINWWAF